MKSGKEKGGRIRGWVVAVGGSEDRSPESVSSLSVFPRYREGGKPQFVGEDGKLGTINRNRSVLGRRQERLSLGCFRLLVHRVEE